MIKNTLKWALLTACAFLSTTQAATLSIQLPNNSNLFTTTTDSIFDARIFVDGLPDFGGFDLVLNFNSTRLQAISLTTNSIFGVAETETFANSVNPGSVHFAESISGTTSLTEGLNISGPTLLGTIQFKALATGLNNLISFSNAPLIYDYYGTSLGGTLQNANVTINEPAAVPLPTSVIIFVSGLLSMFGFRTKKAIA